MGELLLCSQMMAASPYYIDSISLHIYSLEELSYYIEKNIYLLETDFMNEELCTWIERELRQKELAAKLRKICRGRGSLVEFVTGILEESGYHSTEKMRQLLGILAEMEQKSEYECQKLRADRYAENGRYINAIYEYRKLLRRDDEKNVVLIGNVWHNLGRAYTGIFQFEEAVTCFTKAYELNENPESLRESLYACRCMQDEMRYQQIEKRTGLSDEESGDIKAGLTQASRMEDIRQFETQVDEWIQKGATGQLGEILEEWKNAYRKNCRI